LDGTAHTIALVEDSGRGVNWMEPRDVSLDEAVKLLTTNEGSGHMLVDDGFLAATYCKTSQRNVAFCDSHVEFIGQLADPAVARGLFTVAGGEPGVDDYVSPDQYVEREEVTVVKWNTVYSLVLFVVLSLLPAVWTRWSAKTQRIEGK
jgi:prepilin-type processing-associated H-X9-DG protein